MDIDIIIDALTKFGKKQFTKDDLKRIIGTESTLEYFTIIQKLESNGIIKGVKGTKGTKSLYNTYNKYKLVEPAADDSTYQKLRYLYNEFVLDYYKKNNKKLIEDFPYIQKLSDYFNSLIGKEIPECAVNERSYEIFGDEKFLSAKGMSILRNLDDKEGTLIKKLNIYKTREPYFDYVSRDNENAINMLIIENKDTWYSLKKVLIQKGSLRIDNISMSILVYGEGWKILNSLEFLEEKGYRDSIENIYYFGDLDYEGISILQRLRDKYPEYNITPQLKLYSSMMELAKNRVLKKIEDKDQDKYKITEFLDLFIEEDREYLKNKLDEKRYIPQEILSYQTFLQMQEE